MLLDKEISSILNNQNDLEGAMDYEGDEEPAEKEPAEKEEEEEEEEKEESDDSDVEEEIE